MYLLNPYLCAIIITSFLFEREPEEEAVASELEASSSFSHVINYSSVSNIFFTSLIISLVAEDFTAA